MKTLIRSLVLLTLVTIAYLPANIAFGQGVSSSGTDYWLGFMPNGVKQMPGYDYVELFVASSTNNTVTITTGGSIHKYTVQANKVLDIAVPDAEGTTSHAETPSKLAVHVTSINPVTVYGYSVWTCNACIGGSADGCLALPLTALGNKYYVINYYASAFAGYPSSAEFLIVAPYDNTNVTINPTGDTRDDAGNITHRAGKPWTVSLQKGETYLVQSDKSQLAANDLTGSLITSDKPVAVMTGHEITPMPVDQNSAQHFLEMMPAVDKWGTQYFEMPMAGHTVNGGYLRILSAEDDNIIMHNGKGPMILNAGQFGEIEMETDAEVFTSINHKKFIIMQYEYSQGYGGDPGLADPFMVLMTPQEQFEKRMVFRTPTPLKSGTYINYITFVAPDTSIRHISLNGRNITAYTYAGYAKFITPPGAEEMSAYRIQVGDSKTSYFAEGTAPFGAYQYGFTGYEGYGWPAGMAQNIISPDTLAPLATILDSNCGTYTLRFTEPRTQSTGYSFDDTHISSLRLIQDLNDPDWDTPSFNYLFTPDPNFAPGDSVTTGTLTVFDLTKDAYAAIYAVDRAGNDTVYQYRYYAPKVAVSPQPTYTFENVLAGTDSCMTVTFSNVQAAGSFLAQLAAVSGTAKGGTFSVTPSKLSAIDPGKSIPLTVCYHANDTGVTSIDTLNIGSQCVDYQYVLRGSGVTPLIFVGDIDFGSVNKGETLCKPLVLSNPGKAPLVITSQDLVNNANFSVDPSVVFPITIPPGGRVTISYCFHPQDYGSFDAHVLFTNKNPALYVHSIKDTSYLDGISLPSGAKLTSYLKDFGQPSCSDKPTLYDTLYNDLQRQKTVTDVKIIGPDAQYFTLSSTGNQPTYPFSLEPDSANSLNYSVQFDPMLTGVDFTVRKATLQSYVQEDDGSIVPGPSAQLTGVLSTPVLALSTTSLNLGTTGVGASISSTFTISNSGNAPFTVSSYNLSGADAADYTLSPAPPFTVQAGDQQVVTVTATSASAGDYRASATFTGGCTSISTAFEANFNSGGDVALGTSHPPTFIGGCRNDVKNASFHNSGTTYPITVVSVDIEAANGWNDTQDFTLESSVPQQDIAPNGTLQVPIVFAPTSVGNKAAALVFQLSGKTGDGRDSSWSETAELQGEGTAVTRQVAVGSVASAPAFTAADDVKIDVPVVVDQSIEQNAPTNGSTEIYGYQFTLSWLRDAFKYADVTNSGSVNVTAGPETYDATTGRSSITFTGSSATPISNVVKLADVGLLPRLNKDDETPIAISNVTWTDKQGLAACYVTNTLSDQAFQLQPACGTATIQRLLKGEDLTTSLDGISPNPVHRTASITYHVNEDAPVTISIYDVMGNEVARLLNAELKKKGTYSVTLDASNLGSGTISSGTYFCRLSDGQRVSTKQFTMEK